jgi:hypothetical protein
MNWYGWLWSRGRWERVCSAPTLGACASQLGRIGGRRGIPARWQVMTGGGPPTFTPRNAAPERWAASTRPDARPERADATEAS